MPRRKESVADLFVRLPWWASLLAAGVAYVAGTVVAPLVVPENYLAPALKSAAGTFGTVFGVIFLVMAVLSAIRAARRLLDKQASIESIRALTWQEFEVLIADAFRRKGYFVVKNGGAGAGARDPAARARASN